MSEADLMRRIQIKASQLGARLFRMNTGLAWCGIRVPAPQCGPQAIILLNARPFKAGIKGMSDLCGWKPVVITPEMVGRTLAVYVACEVKDGAPTTKEQQHFLCEVIKNGGIGLVARSEKDIEESLYPPA